MKHVRVLISSYKTSGVAYKNEKSIIKRKQNISSNPYIMQFKLNLSNVCKNTNTLRIIHSVHQRKNQMRFSDMLVPKLLVEGYNFRC